jgi:hypothetical protein
MTKDQASDIMVRVRTAILGTEEALRLASMFADPDYTVCKALEKALRAFYKVRDRCQRVIERVKL